MLLVHILLILLAVFYLKFNTFNRLYHFCIISFSYISDLFILVHGCKKQSILHKNEQMPQVKMLFTLQWVHRLQ